MNECLLENGATDPLQAIKDFGLQWSNYFNFVHQLMADYEHLKQRLKELEGENATLKETLALFDDEWIQNTTMVNVTEYIADKESKNIRDVLTAMYEALLPTKKSSKLKRAIKKRIKELNSDDTTKIQIEKVEGDFNVNKTVKQIDN